jgi:hypothetical protein
MKNLIVLCLLGISILFSGCYEDPVTADVTAELKSAKKPAPKLVGAGEIIFTPTTPPTFWNGTVDFGDAGEYKITFESLGDAPSFFSQADHFEENFFIYDITASWPPSESEIVLTGHHSGVIIYANKLPEPSKFHANGKVTGAFDALEMWMGCTTHFGGKVIWDETGVPSSALLTIRIN